MWKKKRYDIHIRLSPEEIEAVQRIFYIVQRMEGILKDSIKKDLEITKEFYWKIHNKCVEINRK